MLSRLFALAGCSVPPYSNVDNTELKALLEQGVPIYNVRNGISRWIGEGNPVDRN